MAKQDSNRSMIAPRGERFGAGPAGAGQTPMSGPGPAGRRKGGFPPGETGAGVSSSGGSSSMRVYKSGDPAGRGMGRVPTKY